MKKKIIYVVGFIVFCIILYSMLTYYQATNEIVPMKYTKILENIENINYKGFNNFFNIEYDKPIIEKREIDGVEQQVLTYHINIKNITDKKLNLFVTLYYQNIEFAKEYFHCNLEDLENFKFLGDRSVEVDVGKNFGITMSSPIDIENYKMSKEFFYDNYGKFIGYFIIKDKEYKEYIETFDVNN